MLSKSLKDNVAFITSPEKAAAHSAGNVRADFEGINPYLFITRDRFLVYFLDQKNLAYSADLYRKFETFSLHTSLHNKVVTL